MNNLIVSIMILAAAAGAAIQTDLPDKLKDLYMQALTITKQVCTAGDLKTISVMLDAGYIMDRRLPSEEEFKEWMVRTFKENRIKDLTVDHWGNPLIYRCFDSCRRYELRSAGPDGIPDNRDDLVVSGP